MRKLVIGMAAVALLALMAVPAMADQLAQKNLDVSITVDPYGGIILDSTVYLIVTAPWLSGAGSTQTGEKPFTVLCNVNSTLTVTAPSVTQAKNAPGENLWYPTAKYTDGASVDHYIGFGVVLYNTAASSEMPWDDTVGGKEAHVSFALGDTPDDLTTNNAKVMIISATDSSRDTDALAPVGTYTTYLILTLTTA